MIQKRKRHPPHRQNTSATGMAELRFCNSAIPSQVAGMIRLKPRTPMTAVASMSGERSVSQALAAATFVNAADRNSARDMVSAAIKIRWHFCNDRIVCEECNCSFEKYPARRMSAVPQDNDELTKRATIVQVFQNAMPILLIRNAPV